MIADARSGDRAMAWARGAQHELSTGHDLNGLDADAAGGSGSRADWSDLPDGENLLPILTEQAAPHSRTLFWRFRASAHRAVCEGDWKYLRIASNEFLFDVGKDSRERAYLRNRDKDVRTLGERLGRSFVA